MFYVLCGLKVLLYHITIISYYHYIYYHCFSLFLWLVAQWFLYDHYFTLNVHFCSLAYSLRRAERVFHLSVCAIKISFNSEIKKMMLIYVIDFPAVVTRSAYFIASWCSRVYIIIHLPTVVVQRTRCCKFISLSAWIMHSPACVQNGGQLHVPRHRRL